MLIGSFAPENGSILSKICTRSCHMLLFELFYKTEFVEGTKPLDAEVMNNTTRLRLDLQDNSKGLLSSVIPSIELDRLMEISTRKEGFAHGFLSTDDADMPYFQVVYPVMLTHAGNFDLNADKFLEINLTDIPKQVTSVRIYAYDVDMVAGVRFDYNKMNIPNGVSREKYVLGNSDILVLPTDGFDEIQLTYPSGLTSRWSLSELRYTTAIKNDVVMSIMDYSERRNVLSVDGFLKSFIVDLDGAVELEIIRDSASNQSFEFLLLDIVQDTISKNVSSKLVTNTIGSVINLDGTLSTKGAELKSFTKNASVAQNNIAKVDLGERVSVENLKFL